LLLPWESASSVSAGEFFGCKVQLTSYVQVQVSHFSICRFTSQYAGPPGSTVHVDQPKVERVSHDEDSFFVSNLATNELARDVLMLRQIFLEALFTAHC
jgi:hypothetical protein